MATSELTRTEAEIRSEIEAMLSVGSIGGLHAMNGHLLLDIREELRAIRRGLEHRNTAPADAPRVEVTGPSAFENMSGNRHGKRSRQR
jgi:hypothetical protein